LIQVFAALFLVTFCLGQDDPNVSPADFAAPTLNGDSSPPYQFDFDPSIAPEDQQSIQQGALAAASQWGLALDAFARLVSDTHSQLNESGDLSGEQWIAELEILLAGHENGVIANEENATVEIAYEGEVESQFSPEEKKQTSYVHYYPPYSYGYFSNALLSGGYNTYYTYYRIANRNTGYVGSADYFSRSGVVYNVFYNYYLNAIGNYYYNPRYGRLQFYVRLRSDNYNYWYVYNNPLSSSRSVYVLNQNWGSIRIGSTYINYSLWYRLTTSPTAYLYGTTVPYGRYVDVVYTTGGRYNTGYVFYEYIDYHYRYVSHYYTNVANSFYTGWVVTDIWVRNVG